MKSAFFGLLIILNSFMLGANAWWCGGHMLVANIAYQTVDNATQTMIQGIAQAMSASGPFPKSPDFTQMACWADDIKYNIGVMEGWHFINLPYNPQNLPIPASVDVENVEYVLVKFAQSLKQYKSENAWELAFSLANYVHFMGDIHQPLHCATLFSNAFPQGDQGGNLFKVYFQGNKTALHAVWDSVGGLYSSDNRPLSPSDLNQVFQDAKSLVQQYTFPSSKVGVYNTTVIGQESFNLAVSAAYAGIKPLDTLSASYISNCQTVSQSQITLAGLRLAKQLQYFFGIAKEKGVYHQWVRDLAKGRNQK